MKLHDKVALVTGSARGLGWEMIQAFAQEGARVAICDISQADVDGAAGKLGLPQGKVLGIEADVTSERNVIDLLGRTLEKFKRLDILVNNAGFAWPRGGPVNLELAETPLEVWLKVLGTNLTGTFLCVKYAAPHMVRRGWGRIVNTSSVHGRIGGRPTLAHYGAAKAGVIALSRTAARELAPHGITVNVVSPGYIDTERLGSTLPRERLDAIAKQIPVGRIGRPAEIAAAVVFLASDGAAFVNGAVLDIHGGRMEYA